MARERILENTYLTYLPSEKFKTGFLSAQLVLPLEEETAALDALLVNVLSRGTERYPDMEAVSARLDELYGARLDPTVRKVGESHVVGFAASCVDDRLLPGGERLLEPLADLMGEMLLRPAREDGGFVEDFVDGERSNLVDLIESEINEKRTYAAKRLIEEMCAGEPFGVSRLGTGERAASITPEELEARYEAILPRARLELFYCGGAPLERVQASFRGAFAGRPRGECFALPPITRRGAPASPKRVEEAMDVSQGKLCLGFRVEGDDVPAGMLMNAMFGGTSNSKLFLNVREKLSLCYYASSAYYRRKGILTVSSGIEFANYQRAVDEIFAQLDAIRRGEWEAWELDGARSALLNTLRTMEDSAGALEDFHLQQAVSGGEETLGSLAEDIRAVTPERVRAAAERVKADTIYFLKGKEARPCV